MRKLILAVLIYTALFSQSQLLSPIPLPSNTIIDLDPQIYDDDALYEALEKGEIFTFLAKSFGTKNPELRQLRQNYMALFSLKSKIFGGGALHVAFIIPYKIIGKYAASTTNSALAFLLTRGVPFKMDTIVIEDESDASLFSAIEQVEQNSFDLVVAPLTPKGAQFCCDQAIHTRLYIPTLHKNRVVCQNDMVYFGGIDYESQIETLSLLTEKNTTKITVSDQSSVSQMLSQLVAIHIDVERQIVLTKSGYYKNLIERYDDLNQSDIFLNTPVVKSSLFLSQLTLADFKPEHVLSTQINYSPLLLTLTQYHDRDTMVIASSIGEADPVVTEEIALVDQDIRFNWINYATVVGLDAIFANRMTEPRIANENFQNNSLNYDTRLYDAGLFRFVPRPLPESEMEIDEESLSILEE
ncbi:hypothetical protein [Hydrogenimonas sp.]